MTRRKFLSNLGLCVPSIGLGLFKLKGGEKAVENPGQHRQLSVFSTIEPGISNNWGWGTGRKDFLIREGWIVQQEHKYKYNYDNIIIPVHKILFEQANTGILKLTLARENIDILSFNGKPNKIAHKDFDSYNDYFLNRGLVFDAFRHYWGLI